MVGAKTRQAKSEERPQTRQTRATKGTPVAKVNDNVDRLTWSKNKKPEKGKVGGESEKDKHQKTLLELFKKAREYSSPKKEASTEGHGARK